MSKLLHLGLTSVLLLFQKFDLIAGFIYFICLFSQLFLELIISFSSHNVKIRRFITAFIKEIPYSIYNILTVSAILNSLPGICTEYFSTMPVLLLRSGRLLANCEFNSRCILQIYPLSRYQML